MRARAGYLNPATSSAASERNRYPGCVRSADVVFDALPAGARMPVAAFALAALVAASALLSAAEAALLGCPRRRREDGAPVDPRWERVDRLLEHPQRIILTVGVATTLLNVGAAVLAALLAFEAFPDAKGVAAAVVVAVGSFVILTFAEVLPKAVASHHAEGWSQAVATPFAVVSAAVSPLVLLYLQFNKGVLRLAGNRDAQTSAVANEEELKTLITIGAEEGIIEDDEEEMIHSVLEFGDTAAREIMVPRADIVAVPADATLDHVRAFVLEAGYSRVPAYQGTLDNIVGVVLVKDMLVRLVEGKGASQVRDLMKDPLFVPETMKLDDLLKEMREKRMHLAVVVDEFGAITGLVSLEDLIEEIIGDISDEYDLRSEPIRRLDARTAVVDARTHVEDVNSALGIGVPEGPYDTLGGFVFHRLGRLGREGESVRDGDIEVVVDKVVNRRIVRVKVVQHGPAPGDERRADVMGA